MEVSRACQNKVLLNNKSLPVGRSIAPAPVKGLKCSFLYSDRHTDRTIDRVLYCSNTNRLVIHKLLSI